MRMIRAETYKDVTNGMVDTVDAAADLTGDALGKVGKAVVDVAEAVADVVETVVDVAAAAVEQVSQTGREAVKETTRPTEVEVQVKPTLPHSLIPTCRPPRARAPPRSQPGHKLCPPSSRFS